jgi:hypothetical protein
VSTDGELYERDPEAWNAYLAEGNAKQAATVSAPTLSSATHPAVSSSSTPPIQHGVRKRREVTGINQAIRTQEPAAAGRNAKIDWKALSKRIGHADVAFTMKQYVQTDLEADCEVANTLADLIVGGLLVSGIDELDGETAGPAFAGAILGAGWTCSKCKAVYISGAPGDALCETCRASDL